MAGANRALGIATPMADPEGDQGEPPSDARYLADMQRAFDALAPHWDAEHGPVSRNAVGFRSCVAYLRRVSRELRTPHVLDLGCGTGQHILHLSDLISTSVGVDLSPGMIRQARVNAPTWPFGTRIRFDCAAMEKVQPDRFGQFDLVLFIGSLEHMLHPYVALRAAKRMLTPDGQIVAIIQFPPRSNGPKFRRRDRTRGLPYTHHLTANMLHRAATKAGLRAVCVNALPLEPSMREPQVLIGRPIRRYRSLAAVSRYAARLEPLAKGACIKVDAKR